MLFSSLAKFVQVPYSWEWTVVSTAAFASSPAVPAPSPEAESCAAPPERAGLFSSSPEEEAEALPEPVLVWPQPDSAAMEKIRASARPRLRNRFISSLLSPLNAVGA